MAAIVGAGACALRPQAPPPPPRVTPASRPAPGHLELLPQADPLLVDLDGDGVDEVAVAMLDAADQRTAMHVTAFDGRSFAVLWRARGLPASRSAARLGLAAAERTVVVRDASGAVTLLDGKTGALRTDGVFQVGCIGPGCPPQAGAESPSERWTPTLAARSRHETNDGLSVEFGVSRGDPSSLVPQPHAEVRDRTTDHSLWEGHLTKPGDTVVLGEMRGSVADGTIYAAYSDASALITLTATEARTGKHLWSARVRATYGATLRAVRAARGRVYVHTDVAVDVYEARGKHVGSIASVP